MAASDDSPSHALTVAGLIAEAQAANLPPPTVQTLMGRLVYPCPTLALYSDWTATREDEFLDASHHASKPATAFSGVLSLPSLGSLLSRTGSGVLSSAVGDAKNRALSDLNGDERAALDKALETFFSPRPTNTCGTSLLNAVQSLWGIFKIVVPDLPQRTWKVGWCPQRFDRISSGVASSPLVRLSDDMYVQPIFGALKNLVSNEGSAGVHGYHELDLANRALLEGLEKKLADPIWRPRPRQTSEVVLLLSGSHFVPVFILSLVDSDPSLRKLLDSFRVPQLPPVSVEALGVADSQVVADLLQKIPNVPTLEKYYIVVYGSEAPVDYSREPGQPSLLHILLLAALDLDHLRETIGRELLHLLTPLPEDSSSDNLSQSPATDLPQPLERAEGLVPALEAKSTAQTDSLNNVASVVSSGMSAVSVASTSVQQTVAPAGYRLVTFDELEKGCEFAAAFVDHAGELVGFHRFPTSKPVKPLSPAAAPSLPPTPPPTSPRAASIEPEDDLVYWTFTPPKPLLLLSGTRFGTGHQGYVYRAHCADAPFPLLAKYSYDREGHGLMKDEAAFYRKNHDKLEDERLAPRFVGSWETEGEDSPMRYGAFSMMLLVEEWGQALDCWSELDGDEAQRHMKELAMRFHLTLGYEHNSLSPRNVVWRREDGPSSLRLIDFVRSEPHWCDTDYTCCYELSRLGRNLGCGLRLSKVRNFVGQRKTREELGRVAAVQHELEEQASGEVELGRTVAATVVVEPRPERAKAVQGGVVTGQKRKASNGRKGRKRDDGAASRPSTPRQRPAKRKA